MLKMLKKLVISIMLMSNICSCVALAQDNSVEQLAQTQITPQIMCILDAEDERRE